MGLGFRVATQTPVRSRSLKGVHISSYEVPCTSKGPRIRGNTFRILPGVWVYTYRTASKRNPGKDANPWKQTSGIFEFRGLRGPGSHTKSCRVLRLGGEGCSDEGTKKALQRAFLLGLLLGGGAGVGKL